MLNCASITFLMLLFAAACTSNYLPSDFPKCYRDDPKLNECMLKAFNDMRERARLGIKEIGLPSLNKLGAAVTIKEETVAANVTFKIPNYTLERVDNYDIKEFEYDPDKMIVRIKLELDSLFISGYGTADGNVAVVPLRGTGTFRAEFGPIKSIIEIKGKMKRSRGIDFYDTKDVTVNLIVDDGVYRIEGFFDNNEQLNRIANQAFNENTKLITKTVVTPALEKLAEAGVRRFMKRLTNLIPYNELLPLHS